MGKELFDFEIKWVQNNPQFYKNSVHQEKVCIRILSRYLTNIKKQLLTAQRNQLQ